MSSFITVLGCDFSQDIQSIGSRTRAHCKAALEWIKTYHPNDPVLVFSPGMWPRHQEQPMTMAEMMERHVRSLGYRGRSIVARDRLIWGSIAEIRYAIKVSAGHQLVVVSGGYHIPRLKLIVLLLGGRQLLRRTVFYKARERPISKKAFLHEIIGFPYTVWFLLLRRRLLRVLVYLRAFMRGLGQHELKVMRGEEGRYTRL